MPKDGGAAAAAELTKHPWAGTESLQGALGKLIKVQIHHTSLFSMEENVSLRHESPLLDLETGEQPARATSAGSSQILLAPFLNPPFVSIWIALY